MTGDKCRCGAPAYIYQRADQTQWQVKCQKCGLAGRASVTRSRALTSWRWTLMQGANAV